MSLPAARLGDTHVCTLPAHDGGPALAPCAPTILVEGQAAARIGDQLACKIGKPGTIIQGAPHVLMAGSPAARWGSATSHGGIVTRACDSVLIGDIHSLGSKAERVQARLALIAAAHAKAGAMSDDPQAQADLLAVAARLARTNVAVEHIRLCDSTYQYPPDYRGDDPDEHGSPPGWERIDIHVKPGIGFMAAVYRSTIDGSIVIVFRGTDPQTGEDWAFGNLNHTVQHAEAIAYAQQIIAMYGPGVMITGDSLGGGLATAAAIATGASANVFNTAPFTSTTLSGLGLPEPTASPPINAYGVDGEILSHLPGTRHGTHHRLPAYGGPSFKPGTDPGEFELLPGDPTARRTDVPLDPRRGALLRLLLAGGKYSGSVDYGAMSGIDEALLRHMPQTVIDSIEAQKAADIAILQGALR